jgi:radical SAM superfamily enzyme YgiQ (UPF0313 family)
MRILLIRPNYRTNVVTPPLGLGYIASYLKSKGIEVKVVDGLRDKLERKQIQEQAEKYKPNAIGINSMSSFYFESIELAKELKEAGFRCILGGIHPSFCPYQTLRDSQCDFVFCGEGEQAFWRLIENDFSNLGIKGIYSKDDLDSMNQKVELTPPVENLDSLPFPDWSQMDPKSYPLAPHGFFLKQYPFAPIVTSRGCPFNCSFCATPNLYGRKIRFRSPENVVSEIKMLVRTFGVKEIHFEDDNLTLNKNHIQGICKKIIENNLNISWACPNGIRADTIDYETLALMKRSGCYSISFGIESASDSILKKINKKEQLSNIKKAIQLCNKLGIVTNGFFIFGLPGETKETLRQTIHFALSSGLDGANFNALNIFPGSEIWKNTKSESKCTSFLLDSPPQWTPRDITKKDVVGARRKAFLRFYLRPKILFATLKRIKIRQVYYILKRFFSLYNYQE